MAGPNKRVPRGMKPSVENPGKILKRLLGYVFRYYKVHMIVVFVSIIVSVLANLQGTMFLQKLIDDYIEPMLESGSRDYEPLLWAILQTAGYYAVGILCTYANNRIMVNVTQGTLRRLRDDMFNHMESLSIGYFDSNSRGDIMSMYTNDIDTLRQMISQSLPQLFEATITVLGVTVCMIILNIPLTIVTFIMLGVMLFATKGITKKSGSFFIAQQKDVGALNGFIEERMTGQKVVKVFNHEEECIEEFDQLNDRLFDSAYNANKYANMLMPAMAQIGNLSYVLCAVVGAVLIMTGFGISDAAFAGIAPLTIGSLFSFLQLNKRFVMPINQMSMQLNSIVMAMAGADRVFKLLDQEPERDDGYVMLVNAKEQPDGTLTETDERTGLWA